MADAPSIRVLVVDDEPHISLIIRMRLEQGPFVVMLADRADEALALLQAHPDTRLVILDLMLPGLSGMDILRILRADARWHTLPCLVLTAAGQDAQFAEADQLGVAEIMTKPFSPRRLFERVTALTQAAGT
jgi:DNA-binding response OmpR family regulator